MTRNQKQETENQQAMNTALRMLTYRDHTRYEIGQKLKQRGFSSEAIRAVIEECERLNYIDDERTARIFIGQLLRRGFGIRRIAIELKKKGLQGKHVENILQQQQVEIDEREIARRVLQKKLKSFEREADPQKRRNKLYRFLVYRGFDRSTISELIKVYFN